MAQPLAWSGGGGSGAAPGQYRNSAITPGFSGGGGGGYSGGNGGGTTNSNITILCTVPFNLDPPTGCLAPGPVVPAGGGTSFASGMLNSAVFQLGPSQDVFTRVPGLNQNPALSGFVQVVRLG